MSALRQEILNYIDELPDSKLEALKPILTILVNDTLQIDTDLTEEETRILEKGRKEYKDGNFIPLDNLV